MPVIDCTLIVRARVELEDEEATSRTVRYLLEEDLLDKGWDVDVELRMDEPKWIPVSVELPVQGEDTWVYAINREWGTSEVEIDTWVGNRGDEVRCVGPNGETIEKETGWYHYQTPWEITHWMPIEPPEPPEEGGE